jgi:hypothetical protein
MDANYHPPEVGISCLWSGVSLFERTLIMTKNIAKFTFNGRSYPIEITWKLAYSTLPEKFEIEILKLFINDQITNKVVSQLLLDDELALKVCWFFLEPQVSFDFDKFVELLDTEPEAIDGFREVFWGAVVNFSSPQKKGVLRDLWDQMKKEMKALKLESPASSTSLSDSNHEGSS